MLIVLLAAFLQAGAAAARPIDRGVQSRVEEARQAVVRSAAEWTVLWRAHATRPQPPIDFGREMVIAIFLGSRPTAGYAVDVVGTRDEDGVLVVDYRVIEPPRDAITAQVITSPYVMVAVPVRAGEVRFRRVSG